MRKYLNIRFIWKINAILIFAAGAMICIFLTFQIFSIVRDLFGARHVENVVQTEREVQQDWDLGRFDAITGSGFIVAPVTSRQSYHVGSLNKESTAVRNYLFVSLADLSSHWLLPNQNSIVLSLERYGASGPVSASDEKRTPVRWLLVTRLTGDTNGDRAITEYDRRTVSVASPDGSSLRDVVRDIDDILGEALREDGRLILIYTAKGHTSVSTIDMDTARVLQTKPLPRPGA